MLRVRKTPGLNFQRKLCIVLIATSLVAVITIAGSTRVDATVSKQVQHLETVRLAQGGKGNAGMSDIDTVRAFMEAFNARDVNAIMGFFAEDAVYHNIPTGPVKGLAGIRNLIEFFVGPADKIDFEILNIAQTGSTVLTERIDRFVIKGEDIALPVMGAFDMKDGKIAEWRDYFDMAMWQKQQPK